MKKRILSVVLSVLLIFSFSSLSFAYKVFYPFDEDGFTTAVLNGWQNKSEKIQLIDYNISRTRIYYEYLQLWLSHPELVNVSSIVNISFNSTDYVTYVTPTYYSYTDSQIASFNKKVDSLVNEFKDRSDIDKIISVYEYLVENAKYDYRSDSEAPSKYSAYEAIMGDRCVCQGYSLAFMLLLSKLGIECHYINCDKMDHAWNLVKLNGTYYYVDITWDYYTHGNLLVSEATLVNNNHNNSATDWSRNFDISVETTSTSEIIKELYVNGQHNSDYEYNFWSDAVNRMSYADGYWYYTDGKDIYKASTSAKTDVKITNHTNNNEYFWFSAPGAKTGYSNRSDVEYADGKIYFTTPTQIKCIDTDGKNEYAVYTLSASEKSKGYIYDITVKDNKLEYKLSFDPLCVNYIDRFTYTGSLTVNCGQHDLSLRTALVPSTCTELGTDKIQCSKCLYFTIGDAVKYAEHTYGSWNPSAAATCTKQGEEKRVCTVSGCKAYEIRYTGYASHTYGDWVVKTSSTCIEQGIRERKCTKCPAVDSEKLPYGQHKTGSDGICTVCRNRTCTCLCHRTGFLHSIYKIARFFWKIFDYNSKKVCECGAVHY